MAEYANEVNKGSEEIIISCGGREKIWTNREEAKEFFLQGMLACEGSEAARYTQIYEQLCAGLTACTDGF